jgi:hypothetical protein
MEIVRVAFARSRKQLSREDFCEQLRRILAEQFPDETVERVTHRGSSSCAFLAARCHREPPDVWTLVAATRSPAGSGTLSALRLILPQAKSAIVAHRLAAIIRIGLAESWRRGLRVMLRL